MSEVDGPDSGSILRDIDLIRIYRINHNLAPDHPFWTNERILFAILIGME